MVKNLELLVYYNFGAEGAVYYNFGAFWRFLKRRRRAEDSVYYQFWRRRRFLLSKTFCKHALYCIVDYV